MYGDSKKMFVFCFCTINTANRKRAKFFFFRPHGDLEKNVLHKNSQKKTRTAKKRRATKMLRDKDRVLSCAHQASRRLLRKTAILTQMLRPRNSATVN